MTGLSATQQKALDYVINRVRDDHGILWLDILDPSKRSRRYCAARHHAMFLLRATEQWSVVEIAEVMQRDHTTVSYGIKSWQERNRR